MAERHDDDDVLLMIYVKHLRILCLADFNNYVVWIISKV